MRLGGVMRAPAEGRAPKAVRPGTSVRGLARGGRPGVVGDARAGRARMGRGRGGRDRGMAVEVGQQAPDFELSDQHAKPVRLSSFRGVKNVVLVFYPLAFSEVCSGELCALRDDFPEV